MIPSVSKNVHDYQTPSTWKSHKIPDGNSMIVSERVRERVFTDLERGTKPGEEGPRPLAEVPLYQHRFFPAREQLDPARGAWVSKAVEGVPCQERGRGHSA